MFQSVARATRITARALVASVAVLTIAAAIVGASACTSPTSPTFRAAFTKTDVTMGTGAEAASGQTLMVNYSGWLYDDTKADKKGELFDSSSPGQPFVFRLGASQVIQGWELGIAGMKVGGLRRLVVPSALAYGRDGAGSKIPPNATLVFDIELLSVVGG